MHQINRRANISKVTVILKLAITFCNNYMYQEPKAFIFIPLSICISFVSMEYVKLQILQKVQVTT